MNGVVKNTWSGRTLPFLLYFLCYGPYVCVPPEFIRWNPNPRCWDIWRWCLWEVSRVRGGHEGGVLLMALVPFQKRKRDQSSSPLPHVRTQREGDHLQAREIALPRIWPWWHLDPGFTASGTMKKYICLANCDNFPSGLFDQWAIHASCTKLNN